MNMTTEQAQDLCNMSDDELLDELTRPTGDLEYKLYVNSIALIRILSKVCDMEESLGSMEIFFIDPLTRRPLE